MEHKNEKHQKKATKFKDEKLNILTKQHKNPEQFIFKFSTEKRKNDVTDIYHKAKLYKES